MNSNERLQGREYVHILSALRSKERYEQTKSLQDLQEAIRQMETVVTIVPDSDWEDTVIKAYILDVLAELLSTRSVALATIADVEAAVSHGTHAVAIMPRSHELYTRLLHNLSKFLERRFRMTNNIRDLNSAIENAQTAIKLTPTTDSDRRVFLETCVTHLSTRYRITQSGKDLDQAIMFTEELLDVLHAGNPLQHIFLCNYGVLRWTRYRQSGRPEDLETSIARIAEALVLVPLPDKQRRGKVLSHLAVSLLGSTIKTYDESELDLALSCAEESVQLADETVWGPERGERLSTLGVCLRRVYRVRLDLEYLHRAILVTEEAVRVTPKDDAYGEWPCYVNQLGMLRSMLYERTRDLEDLDAATQLFQDATDAAGGSRSAGGDTKMALYHLNLAKQYGFRADRTGQLTDFDLAVHAAEAAVQAGQEYPNMYPGCLNDLAKYLVRRYEATNEMADLDAAIEWAGEAVETTMPEYRDREEYAIHIHNLATFLFLKYNRKKFMEDLERAIEMETLAVELRVNTIEYPVFLNSLSLMLRRKFARTKEMSHLHAAVSRAKAAVASAPAADPIVAATCMNNLAIMQSQLALTFYMPLSGLSVVNLFELEKAVKNAQQALDSCPVDHPHSAGFSFNLAVVLARRFQISGHVDDLQRSIECMYRTWDSVPAPLWFRLRAASFFATHSLSHPKPDLKRVESVLREAVELIPVATARWLARGDQEDVLGMLPDMSSLAAAVSLEVGRSPIQALQLLEIGRCVTSGHLLDYRSDLRALKLAHPELGSRFAKLCEEADSPGKFTEIERRRETYRQIDRIIAQIRQLPTFENFLQTGSEEDIISRVASHGPVVLLNVTHLRSDAIVITKQSIQLVPLPGLNDVTAQSHLGELNRAIRNISLSTFKQTNDNLREVWLPWLWREAVKPVLQALGLTSSSDVDGGGQNLKRKLGRVWWAGVGSMAAAPLHAAGVYTDTGANPESTLKYCIPSYTPTVRALMYSRQNGTPTEAKDGSSESSHASIASPPKHDLLVVSMPTTPGNTPLDVERETSEIQRIIPSSRHLQRPNVKQVLEELPKYNMVHFACHGLANSENPSESALLLVKQNPSTGIEELDTLSVEKLSARRLMSARVAYLSACSTAELSSDSKIIDEVIHVASSFQLSGFRHVLGTLWQTDDSVCVEMAREYYTKLASLARKRGAGGLNPSNLDIARAYRESVLAMRKKYPLRPLSWVPYIHLGA